MDWVEELLQIANRQYYERQQAAQTKKPDKHQLIPDIKDDEYWSKGETLS